MKKLIKTIVISIIIYCSISIINQTFADTLIRNIGPTILLDNPEFFCMDHSKSIGGYSNTGSSTYPQRSYYTDVSPGGEKLEPSTAFAMWYMNKYIRKFNIKKGTESSSTQTIRYNGADYATAWNWVKTEPNDPLKTDYPLLGALATVQRAVWTSRAWGNTSNVGPSDAPAYGELSDLGTVERVANGQLYDSVKFRISLYGTFYYGIAKPIMDKTPAGESIKIFKDMTDAKQVKATMSDDGKTCTVGPYKIALNLKSTEANKNTISFWGEPAQNISDSAIEYLYTEMTNGNYMFYGISTQYAGYESNGNCVDLEGINGTNAKLVTRRSGGEEISFPIFTYSDRAAEEFYIQFEVDDNAETTGKPAFWMWWDNGYWVNYKWAYAAKTHINSGATSVSWRYNKGKSWQSAKITGDTWIDGYRYATALANVNIKDTAQPLIHADLTAQFVGEYTTWTRVELPEAELEPKASKLGGNVWIDIGKQKTDEKDGIKASEDKNFAGMQVRLIDATTNKVVATTTTDANGNYMFYGKGSDKKPLVSPSGKYRVEFNYNGQIWQPTYLSNELEATKSNAQESSNARAETNQFFSTINAYPNNYVDNGAKLIAYPLKEKMRDSSGNYYINQENKSKVLTYEDVYNKFVEYAKYDETVPAWNKSGIDKETWNRSNTYSDVEETWESWLKNTQKINQSDIDNLILYRQNTFVSAYVSEYAGNGTISTRTIEVSKLNDTQRQNINFGVTERVTTDLNIINDVYKARIIVNGKETTYTYDKRAAKLEGNQNLWKLETRASDTLFNEQSKYNQSIESADYLYDGTQVVGSDGANRNLQVYVTYKVSILNQGSTFVKVNNLLNYMDNDMYEFVEAYTGAKNGNRDTTLTKPTKTDKKLTQTGKYDFESYNVSLGNNIQLAPQEIKYVYMTFKVKNDPNTGRVKLDQDLTNENLTSGKHSLVEIDSYSNYYYKDTKLPKYRTGTTKYDTTISNNTTLAGTVELNATPGNITTKDLNDEGRIITNKNDETKDRQQDDMDDAPSLVLSIKNGDPRAIQGITFEDARNVENNTDNSVIGDGIYKKSDDELVNGITLELVELVQAIDKDGLGTGVYIGEKVWSSYKLTASGNKYVLAEQPWSEYYSNKDGKEKAILNADSSLKALYKQEKDLKGYGENITYRFSSIPAGDYYVRFKYGDTYRTVLPNTDTDVTNWLGKGLNAKSYNGQDYKSTVYQGGSSGINQANVQSAKEIKGYTNYSVQNTDRITYQSDKITPNNATMINAGVDKTQLFYHDINQSKAKEYSDAADIWSIRQSANNAFKTQTNYAADILASHEKVGTNVSNANEQKNLIQELIDTTKMTSQSGVIECEIEGEIDNISFGVVERPKAQLILKKEVESVRVTLADGTVLYDTDKSVSNIAFSKHGGYYVDPGTKRLTLKNKNELEVVQITLDDELTEGATLDARFKFRVNNVGEIDYASPEFYYTGTKKAGDKAVTSSADQVVDYVSNYIQYNGTSTDGWTVNTVKDLIKSVDDTGNIDTTKIKDDLINNKYHERLTHYNVILTTDTLNTDLKPESCLEAGAKKNTDDVILQLSTILSANNATDNLVYNNLAEILKVSNENGRRMNYSIVGNQEMADATQGNNVGSLIANLFDRITPSEPDADSAQKITVIPPTGADRSIFLPITILVSALIIAVAGITIKARYYR